MLPITLQYFIKIDTQTIYYNLSSMEGSLKIVTHYYVFSFENRINIRICNQILSLSHMLWIEVRNRKLGPLFTKMYGIT